MWRDVVRKKEEWGYTVPLLPQFPIPHFPLEDSI
jgi:hypothetical protein